MWFSVGSRQGQRQRWRRQQQQRQKTIDDCWPMKYVHCFHIHLPFLLLLFLHSFCHVGINIVLIVSPRPSFLWVTDFFFCFSYSEREEIWHEIWWGSSPRWANEKYSRKKFIYIIVHRPSCVRCQLVIQFDKNRLGNRSLFLCTVGSVSCCKKN